MQIKALGFFIVSLLVCTMSHLAMAGSIVDWWGTKCSKIEDIDGQRIYNDDRKKKEFANVSTFTRGICNASKSQNINDNDTCVKLTEVSVQNMPQAIQIAKDYVKERYGYNIICHPSIFSCHDMDDHILCKTGSVQNPASYEFVFDQIKVKDSKKYKKGIGTAYCNIFLGDDTNDTSIGEYCTAPYTGNSNTAVLHSGSQITTCQTYDQGLLCYTAEKKRANKVTKLNNKLLSNFGYTAKDLNNGTSMARDAVYVNFQEYDSCDDLSIEKPNTRFQSLKMNLDLQTVAWLASYMGREMQGKLKTFKCDLAPHSCIDKIGVFKVHKKDVLTCYVNGERMDFIFDTLSTHRKKQEKAAWSAMQCMTNTAEGVFDGRRCLGIEQDVCLSSGFQEKITGGTRWDDNLQACVLNAANTAANWRRAEEITVNLGTSVAVFAGVVVTTVVSGGVTVPVLIGVVSSGLGVVFTAASEAQTEQMRTLVDEYNGKLIRCNDATCARPLFQRYFNEILYYLDYVDENVVDAMDDILAKKIDLIIEADKVGFLESLDRRDDRKWYKKLLDEDVPMQVREKIALDALGIVADIIPISQGIIGSIKTVFKKLPRTGVAMANKTSKMAKTAKMASKAGKVVGRADDANTIKDMIIFYQSYVPVN